MRRTLAIVVGWIVLQGAALAADAPATVARGARTDVALTVYNEDLALVRDVREFDVAEGDSTVRFEDVAARIDATTVAVRSLTAPQSFAVVEQSYAFDLTSPEKLLQ